MCAAYEDACLSDLAKPSQTSEDVIIAWCNEYHSLSEQERKIYGKNVGDSGSEPLTHSL